MKSNKSATSESLSHEHALESKWNSQAGPSSIDNIHVSKPVPEAPGIHSLPVEILSTIFEICSEASAPSDPFDFNDMPWVLGRVCQHWRDISWSLSSIWSKISLDFHGTRDSVLWECPYETMITAYLQRSHNHIVYLCWHADDLGRRQEAIMNQIFLHGHSIVSLTIVLHSATTTRGLPAQYPQFTSLQYLSLVIPDRLLTPGSNKIPLHEMFASCPALRTLSVPNCLPQLSETLRLPWAQLRSLSFRDIVDLAGLRTILTATRHLEKLKITGWIRSSERRSPSDDDDSILLEDLTRLKGCGLHILFYLNLHLPSLTELDILPFGHRLRGLLYDDAGGFSPLWKSLRHDWHKIKHLSLPLDQIPMLLPCFPAVENLQIYFTNKHGLNSLMKPEDEQRLVSILRLHCLPPVSPGAEADGRRIRTVSIHTPRPMEDSQSGLRDVLDEMDGAGIIVQWVSHWY